MRNDDYIAIAKSYSPQEFAAILKIHLLLNAIRGKGFPMSPSIEKGLTNILKYFGRNVLKSRKVVLHGKLGQLSRSDIEFDSLVFVLLLCTIFKS